LATRAIAKKQGPKQLDALDKLIAGIEADNDPKPERSMADFIRNPVTPH